MDITSLIDRLVATNLSKKEQLIRSLIECNNLDEIPIRGRIEIHQDKEIYFWDDIPIVEFYTSLYKFTYNNNITCNHELNYKILKP